MSPLRACRAPCPRADRPALRPRPRGKVSAAPTSAQVGAAPFLIPGAAALDAGCRGLGRYAAPMGQRTSMRPWAESKFGQVSDRVPSPVTLSL
jgi:hypothetical protein